MSRNLLFAIFSYTQFIYYEGVCMIKKRDVNEELFC